MVGRGGAGGKQMSKEEKERDRIKRASEDNGGGDRDATDHSHLDHHACLFFIRMGVGSSPFAADPPCFSGNLNGSLTKPTLKQ